MEFGEPIGAARDDPHPALRAAHLRRQLRLPRGELQALAVAGSPRDAPGAGGGARRRRSGERAAEAVPPSAQDGLRAPGRGVRRRTVGTGSGGHRADGGVGPGRRDRLDRGAGRRRGAAARPRARSRPAAPLPPERCIEPGGDVRRARAARLPVRGHDSARRCGREGRRSHRDQARRVPGRADPGRGARARRARTRGPDPAGGRGGKRDLRLRLRGPGSAHRARPPRTCSARPTWS